MFELVGSYESYTPDSYTGEAKTDYVEEVVATFNKRSDAESYIKKSLLKHPRKSCWTSDKPFRNRSLLRPYSWVEVRKKIEDDVPHNPTI